MEIGCYKNVFVIGVEICFKFLNYDDRIIVVLFGDGVGVVVIGFVNEGGILFIYMGFDGKGKDCLKVFVGGLRFKVSKEIVEVNLYIIEMVGSDVFKFVVRKMVEIFLRVFEKVNLNIIDIDYLVLY